MAVTGRAFHSESLTQYTLPQCTTSLDSNDVKTAWNDGNRDFHCWCFGVAQLFSEGALKCRVLFGTRTHTHLLHGAGPPRQVTMSFCIKHKPRYSTQGITCRSAHYVGNITISHNYATDRANNRHRFVHISATNSEITNFAASYHITNESTACIDVTWMSITWQL